MRISDWSSDVCSSDLLTANHKNKTRGEETMTLKLMLAATAAVLLSVAQVPAQAAPEKKELTLGVGGKPLLYYLPLTIAERRGLFKEQGLDVTINDFCGGAKSLQALVGGRVDAVHGAYEHTIPMQQKGPENQGGNE